MFNLHNFDVNDFLQNYWQQKPLLLRAALPDFINPLSPEELAGLACEPDVESRIIIENQGHWELESGPFTDEDFLKLPPDHWTLLVQALDHYVPDVANLLNYFRFIPNWRIDDVMASFASPGGNVGPHQDAYDVFLVQGLGLRHWQVGNRCHGGEKLQNNDQLLLLADFQPQQQWTLEAGDILYLPPGYSHWGIGVGEQCITYSIGFRAPSYAQLLSSFCDYQIEQLDHQLRYSDPQLTKQQYAGEISEATIQQVQNILSKQLQDKEQIKQWFGSYITEAKYSSEQLQNEETIGTGHSESADFDNTDSQAMGFKIMDFEAIKTLIIKHDLLLRNASIRFAFTHTTSGGILFVNGQSFTCSKQTMPLIQMIASVDSFHSTEVLKLTNNEQSQQILVALFNQGYVYCNE